MTPLTLHFPVVGLDGELLAAAGSEPNSAVLAELASRGRASRQQQAVFLQHGTIRKDLLEFLQQPPFVVIFAGTRHTEELLTLMNNVRMPLPVLDALDYFKENDFYTYRHILMVFALADLLSKTILSGRKLRLQETAAASCHDIGKICVPLDILQKAAPLTMNERQALEHHTLAGFLLIGSFTGEFESFSVIAARDHHERRDGSGYPRGISEIGLMLEIIAACDVFDALISPRPYRPKSYDNRTALEELTMMSLQGKFSWPVVQALVSCNRADKPSYEDLSVSLERRGTPPAENSYGIITNW